jgi:hypothetical protein
MNYSTKTKKCLKIPGLSKNSYTTQSLKTKTILLPNYYAFFLKYVITVAIF